MNRTGFLVLEQGPIIDAQTLIAPMWFRREIARNQE